MNFQWILLALFLAAIISNIAKSMRNPMLKNFLRLISILVAFIITFVLQVCGVFQGIVGKWTPTVQQYVAESEFSGVIGSAMKLIVPFISTFLSPLVFTLVFAMLYLLLKIVHVNLIYGYFANRKRKQEIKELKIALKEEKKRMKGAIIENEERFREIIDRMSIEYPGLDSYDYESLDDDVIDRMVDERINKEKKKKKQSGFFKESKEKKAISIVCGVVCGFLLFGITWMGLFYSMDYLSDITDGIKDTNASDTKIYQAVELVDKHFVTPYEESFVYQLYDSMAMVDLMNYTVRMGGKFEHGDQVYYADDISRDQMKSLVRLACEVTSAKSEQVHVPHDIEVILIKYPTTKTLVAEALFVFVDQADIESLDPENPTTGILQNVLNEYKEGGQELIESDIEAISGVIIVAAENRLLAKIISDTSNLGDAIKDKELIKDMIGALSEISVYGPAMEGAFTLGVQMIGPMLMPEDNAAAYEQFVNKITSASNGVSTMTDEDLTNLYTFIKNAATFEKSSNNTTNGILAYVADPLYRAELLKDEGMTLKERADKLQEDADKLIADGEQLKADAERFQADANSLANELESSAVEIAELELKKENDPANFTQADQERLDYFYGLSERKDELEEDAHDLELRGETLKTQGEALQVEAEDLADDVQDLADRAEALITEFEERIKGFTPFITYFMNWNSVQKPFLLADEDKSTACMTFTIDGTVYMCTTDILDIETLLDFVLNDDAFGNLDFGTGTEGEGTEGEGTGSEGSGGEGSSGEGSGGEGSEGGDDFDEDILNITVDEYLNKIPMKELIEKIEVSSDEAEMGGRVSELADLINYLIISANAHKNTPEAAEIDNEWTYAALTSYTALTDKNAVCADLATRICDAKDDHASFDYKGVTVEKMQSSLNFGDEWTNEAKRADSEMLVEIIFTLLTLADDMQGEEAETMNETAGGEEGDNSGGLANFDSEQVQTLIGFLKTLGTAMDQMTDTTCLKDVPPIILEGVLKNEMISMVVTPSMVYGENGYLSRIESGELTYEGFMTELSEMVTTILEKLNSDKGDETV